MVSMMRILNCVPYLPGRSEVRVLHPRKLHSLRGLRLMRVFYVSHKNLPADEKSLAAYRPVTLGPRRPLAGPQLQIFGPHRSLAGPQLQTLCLMQLLHGC